MKLMRLITVIALASALPVAAGCSEECPPEHANQHESGKYLFVPLGRGVAMQFVRIPAGAFMMGSPGSEVHRDKNEGPQHRVMLTRDFYMGVLEVTQSQYEAVTGTNPSHYRGGDNPVDGVSWDCAQAFCQQMSAKTGRIVRLPTEAQWEYACRGGTQTPFNTGATLRRSQANYDAGTDWPDLPSETLARGVIAAGSFLPNAFGLYDMHGNLWEWCSDSYAPYQTGDAIDPQGPASGEMRVARGGSWNLDAAGCRSARRDKLRQDKCDRSRGFRVIIEIAPAKREGP